MTKKKTKAIKTIVNSYFRINGKPYELTNGQCEIFEAVVNPKYRWVWISAPTRYGKTEAVALTAIYLAVFHNLKIPVVAGSEEKAKKIMEYVVQHLPDHPELYAGLINADISQVERLKVTMAKDALRWYSGGWIYITSVDSRSISKEGERVIGEGGDVVILEEAGLIKYREQFSKIVRMPEADRGWGKLVMSGNCIENSVFEDAFKDPLYHKVRISLDQSINEGRFTSEYLEEKKGQTTSKDWKRYYLVEFPLIEEYAFFKPKKYDLLPKELKYYGSIDPSLGESKKGSKTGIIVLGVDKEFQKYEVESIIEKLTPDEAIRKIFNLPYIFQRFVFEEIQFQKYFLEITNRLSKEKGLNIPFEGIRQAKNKTERIESLEPAVNTGQILFKGGNQLWTDMQEYPKIEYLDGLDALEMVHRASQKKKARIGFAGQTW